MSHLYGTFKMAIRVELNEFKMKEMSVHNESRKNTLFYDVGTSSFYQKKIESIQRSTDQNRLVPDRTVRSWKIYKNLGPARTKTNKILKISDQFGLVGSLI